ncbi:Gfo/Idh/MocA family oxidoreductase [Roseomonas sp. PWR1]|uniref:Gfo/Idh/MocA family oxidoreductase n=1 Tax=Roseomonas nitratireducens TaxID=2820810 RepID=A0ABS4ARM8_9PROT|nr:Gfo/Idh/MocA family oxidoreductase [Neoroseomonas nitratireducens]MBP0463986.1 Gfo/Idh/MocA family oxidoreductase [Neoroseomonas nitratireducens]
MAHRRIGIVMHGVTGRIGTNQHLVNSILAIRREGGLPLSNGDRLMPDPILVGRNVEKLQALAATTGIERWTTDLDAALADPQDEIFFDSAYTATRPALARRAIAAGKHIYLEKPVAPTLEEVLDLRRAAEAAGVKHAVVQDKLFLPGLAKLRLLKDQGFFGRLLSVRIDFGWWVFDGEQVPAQRSSWNYRLADGGGLVLDMFPHWRYIMEGLFGRPTSVTCHIRTAQPHRRDERGRPYTVDVEDEARALLELEDGVVAEINASWANRVRRDDLLTITAEGTLGSAVAGLHRCVVQPLSTTPKPVWNVDVPAAQDLYAQWAPVPDLLPLKNSYRMAWEAFLRHVAEDGPNRASLIEAAKGLQLIEACHASHRERRWIDLPDLGG